MKVGINVKIDVTKIEKARLFKGEKGTYLDMTTFVDLDKPGEHGDHGFISQKVSKDERDQGVKAPILGNCKVFWREDAASAERQAVAKQGADQARAILDSDMDDEIPF